MRSTIYRLLGLLALVLGTLASWRIWVPPPSVVAGTAYLAAMFVFFNEAERSR